MPLGWTTDTDLCPSVGVRCLADIVQHLTHFFRASESGVQCQPSLSQGPPLITGGVHSWQVALGGPG